MIKLPPGPPPSGLRENGSGRTHPLESEGNMLWTIAGILIILWLLGWVSSYTMGGFIHILLVVAVIVILVRIISGRRVL